MDGRYELTRRLAASRMAEVYVARDRGARLDNLVVVKRMLPHLLRDAQLVEGFLNEAREAALLDHSNLVKVGRISRDTENCYYAMEYVRGLDLRRLLAGLGTRNWTMSYECAVGIALELCAGLAYLHEQTGIDGKPLVHRDVAPANVLVSAAGEIKLADFGRRIHPTRARERSTLHKRIDAFEGTTGYMSPEQCLGAEVDRRSDLFSLGVILYELSTGARLYESSENDFQIMERTVRGWITPPIQHRPDYPEELHAVVARLLERDPARRFQTARDLERELERVRTAVQTTPAAAAISELVAAAAPDAPWLVDIAAARARVEESVTVVQPAPPAKRAGPRVATAATLTPAQTRGRSKTAIAVGRWLRPPWSYLALAGGAGVGVALALATAAFGGDGRAAIAAPVPVETAPPPVVTPLPAPAPVATTPNARVTTPAPAPAPATSAPAASAPTAKPPLAKPAPAAAPRAAPKRAAPARQAPAPAQKRPASWSTSSPFMPVRPDPRPAGR